MVKHYIGTLLPLLTGFLCLNVQACSEVCGDLFDRSPQSLLVENDEVVYGKFTGMRTVVELGHYNSFDRNSRFMVIEYAFEPITFYKGVQSEKNIYLWNCEYITEKNEFSSIDELSSGGAYLVYGKRINHPNSLIGTLAPIAPVEDLRNLLDNGENSFEWSTQDRDLDLAKSIIQSDRLKHELSQRLLTGTVLHGTDPFLATFSDFRTGALCYYDSDNNGRSVTPDEYLAELDLLSSSSK